MKVLLASLIALLVSVSAF